MSFARYLIGDVFDALKTVPNGSVDLVITSPPFLALRSYLPADDPLKDKEIGSEATPAAFLDVMLAVTAELRRVLAEHGSIAIEFGDTYAGSGGAGGDYGEDGWREGQPQFRQSRSAWRSHSTERATVQGAGAAYSGGPGWPLPKSRALIPELYRVALAYGHNPLTGQPSPAGKWRIRNVVTWCRPNPPVGALGDKWRPATSDVVVACVSAKRYWDDLATREPQTRTRQNTDLSTPKHITAERSALMSGQGAGNLNSAGAPLLDWWEITTGGYKGAHYAVFPPDLIVPLVKAMGPQRVCQTCGEPSRREVSTERYDKDGNRLTTDFQSADRTKGLHSAARRGERFSHTNVIDGGWSDCGHDNWRPGHVLDPFAGTGTTLAVATGHGLTATGIDIDHRNAELAEQRLGMFLEHTEEVPT